MEGDMKMTVKIGTQIVYVPGHADTLDHKDVQWGFVTKVMPDGDAFCRYFRSKDSNELRTKANSERTPGACLEIIDSRPQDIVTGLLIELGYYEIQP
jgi:hypothetical protein